MHPLYCLYAWHLRYRAFPEFQSQRWDDSCEAVKRAPSLCPLFHSRVVIYDDRLSLSLLAVMGRVGDFSYLFSECHSSAGDVRVCEGKFEAPVEEGGLLVLSSGYVLRRLHSLFPLWVVISCEEGKLQSCREFIRVFWHEECMVYFVLGQHLEIFG